MTLLEALMLAAAALNGLLGGMSFDGALVKLPTRRRIGAVAYAAFARGNDLGNGLWVYPSIAISAALLTIVATITAFAEHAPVALVVPLSLATLTSIGHFLATAKAAPNMLRVGKTPDAAAAQLMTLLDHFARWNEVRAALQILTFLVLLWALVVAW
jgi:hypothetical protein